MHTTRKAILASLKTLDRATVSDLANAVGVKAVTIRHHLTALLADGLIHMEEQRQALGRPVHVYRLSDKGWAMFPQQRSLVRGVLDQLNASGGASGLIETISEGIAEDIRKMFANLPPGQRMRELIKLLAREGFSAEWQRSDDGLRLVEHQCPYYDFGHEHPELCQIDETMIRAALEVDVQKIACLLSGDQVCIYRLQNVWGAGASAGAG
jgi:DeoR family transcriptional regulator, suf operon transcriptional repressor